MSGRRSWPWILGGGAALAAVAAAITLTGGDDADGSADTTAQLRTAEVVLTDLVDETSYSATFGRVAADAVSSTTAGTVTWLPEAGTTIGNGDVLYEIDGVPVVAFIGDAPLYRDLGTWSSTATLTAGVSGVLTSAPTSGDPVDQGSVLFRVDTEPVVSFVGDVPAYRNLRDERTDLVGDDVTQLETALVELGIADEASFTVDDTFTGSTADAVEAFEASIGATENGQLFLGEYQFVSEATEIVDVLAAVGDSVNPQTPVATIGTGDPTSGDDVAQLQAALVELGADDTLRTDGVFDDATRAAVTEFETSVGLDGDGTISVGEAVFISEPIRVAELAVTLGRSVSPGTPILNVTGEQVVVSLDLPSEDQGVLSVGQAVTVELPDRSEVPATVTEVATSATVTNGTAVFGVVVELDDPSDAAGLDEAPVDVLVVTDSVAGVTAVPVSALVVLREGGYAIEQLVDGVPTLIAAEPGFFADGYVEVDAAVEPGDLVVVP